MEEDLLCPFHYFGITDLEVIADEAKGAEEKLENFSVSDFGRACGKCYETCGVFQL